MVGTIDTSTSSIPAEKATSVAHTNPTSTDRVVFLPQDHFDTVGSCNGALQSNLPDLQGSLSELPSKPKGTTRLYMGQASGDAQYDGADTHRDATARANTDTEPFTISVPHMGLGTPSTAGPIPKDTTKQLLPNFRTANSSQSGDVTSSFQGLALDFPSKGLSEEIGTSNLKFSVRGSMLINGKKLSDNRNGNSGPQLTSATTMPHVNEPRRTDDGARMTSTTRQRAVTSIAERPQTRSMSNDEEALAEKVRAFYSVGSDDQDANSITAKRMNLRWQDAMETRDSLASTSRATSTTDISKLPPSPTITREENELAGGTEDWQDVHNADVDRYGFIVPRSPTSATADTPTKGVRRTPTGSGPGLQRVSTSLQLAAETPRRKRTVRRAPSNPRSSISDHDLQRTPSQSSFHSTKNAAIHRHASASRAISNHFPHNKDRKVLDEAGDMLTLPRSSTTNTLTRTLTDEGTSTTAGTYTPSSTPQSRRKEIERQDKWRKMAHEVPAKPGVLGGGMTFTFDISSPKLIERTWKGIPDTWRSTAWYCFLAASTAKYNKRHPHKPCLSDDVLVSMFHEYQDRNSPDDVQIDIDVPRTISSHIMFRRRYRGGQRLLFRVLHAMSLHFAETGYVQGMAALAATLLAYYEEEKAFIMHVRLWELRGLEELYKHGFGGLIEALDDFETQWLGQGELKKKLDDLMIGPTAYGTRWYLTLFNYSIPFPSQLRVWDVFMLLGDDDYDTHNTEQQRAKTLVPPQQKSGTAITNGNDEKKEEKAKFGTTLDVLHAASAALIDGMRGILLESDFENAMKVLTSWVPIRDEDLFMRVARAEWKMNVQRRLATKKLPAV